MSRGRTDTKLPLCHEPLTATVPTLRHSSGALVWAARESYTKSRGSARHSAAGFTTHVFYIMLEEDN